MEHDPCIEEFLSNMFPFAHLDEEDHDDIPISAITEDTGLPYEETVMSTVSVPPMNKVIPESKNLTRLPEPIHALHALKEDLQILGISKKKFLPHYSDIPSGARCKSATERTR